MRFRDVMLDALHTFKAHKLRTALTMFGIAWGIISITLMVGAGEGLRAGQEKMAAGFGKDVMIVFPGRTSLQAGGMRSGRLIRLRDTDTQFIAQDAPSCNHVLPEVGRGGTAIRSLYNSASLLVVGSLPPFQEIRSIPVAEGRFYNWEDVAQARRMAFIGSDARKQLFAGRAALGATLTIEGFPYTVIGVMEEKEQDSSYDGRDISKIFVPITSLQRDFPLKPPANNHSIERLLVSPQSILQHEECKSQLRAALGRLHQFDPADKEAAFIWDTLESAKAFHQMTDGMKYFLGAVGLTTLLLGGIGVMNVMLVAVRERTREIGVRKAVGATSRSILTQFFVETLIIVFLSGGAGMGIGYGICWLVNRLPMPQFFAGLLPTWESSVFSFALLGTVALLSALYPARRAAAIDPIEALRYEAGG